MGKLFDRYDVEPMKGKDITIGKHLPEIFVSDTDKIFFYPGVSLRDDEQRRRASFMHPYYLHGKHSTDEQTSRKTNGFYRIMEGCIVLDDFVDKDFLSDCTYKRINAGVKLPCPDSYYAVFVNQEEDEDLTRGVFGLTYVELTSLLDAYAKVMGTYCEYFTYPKLTRSIKSENFCDMTELWIPEQFPYIAFSDSGYDFSHVSLFGFYRHVQLLTGCKINSAVSRALLKSGIDEEVLNRLFAIGKGFFYQTKVTKNIR